MFVLVDGFVGRVCVIIGSAWFGCWDFGCCFPLDYVGGFGLDDLMDLVC